MAGNAKPGDQDRPQEEPVESTVAMESPGVTPGVPLPTSDPPPAMPAASSANPADKAKSPVAPAVGPTSSPSPFGARAPLGRPPGPPGIPGSTRSPAVGRVPLPSAGATGAKPPGAPLGPPGVSAKRTVMGLAPPSNSSSSAAKPPAGASPLQRPPGKSPGLPLRPPGAPASPAIPAPTGTPLGAHGVPKLDSDEDEPPDDGVTVASDIAGYAQMSAAAGFPLADSPPKPDRPVQMPAASKQGGAASQRSPFSSTGYAPGGAAEAKAAKPEQEEENDAATVTVPKDVLDRVRADPKGVLADSKPKAPVPAAGRPYSDVDDSAEPTKAVPRDELLGRAAQGPGQDHVVIGADAGGEDATLAVPPGGNEASGMNLGAAIGSALAAGTLQSPLGDGAFPHPPGHPPHSPQAHPYQSYQGMGPPGGPNAMGPGGAPPQQDWGMQGQGQGPPHNQPWSSGQMPAAIPRTPGGVQSYPGGPMMHQPHQPQHQQHQQQMGGIPRQQAPTNWNPLQAPPAKSKISGQMILLFVVGFVCLAIFVTGIILFATTKF